MENVRPKRIGIVERNSRYRQAIAGTIEAEGYRPVQFLGYNDIQAKITNKEVTPWPAGFVLNIPPRQEGEEVPFLWPVITSIYRLRSAEEQNGYAPRPVFVHFSPSEVDLHAKYWKNLLFHLDGIQGITFHEKDIGLTSLKAAVRKAII